MNQMANLATEGGDPRNPEHPVLGQGNEPIETQFLRNAHDPSVTFEEYAYYASITRAEEKAENEKYVAAAGPKTFKSVIKGRFTNYKAPVAVDSPSSPSSPSETGSTDEKNGFDDEKIAQQTALANRNAGGISDAEYKNASRAIRTAGWSSVFYLITTDILGPFSTPYASISPFNNDC